jgi:hypothetical protein
MFWAIAWVLLAALGPVALDPNEKRRATSFFLFAFAAGLLLYFYGRSHDHNLLNLSGIWVLILFVALDRLVHAGIPGVVGPLAASLVVCLAAVGTAEVARAKWDLAKSRVARGLLLEPAELDLEIDGAPDAFAAWRAEPRVFVFSTDDAYLNYRYGLRQVGYFAPFYASVFAEPTAEAVRGLILDGYKVLLLRADPNHLLALNQTQVMLSAHQQFTLVMRGTGSPFRSSIVPLEVQLVAR